MARFRLGDYEAAAEAASKALAMKLQLGDAVGIAHGLRVLGFVACAQGRCERAAVLLGAATPLWERVGYHHDGVPLLEELHRATVRTAIDNLGEARYAWLRDAGAVQPLDEVMALALGSASLPVPEPAPDPAAGASAPQSGATSPDVPDAMLPSILMATRTGVFNGIGPLTSREAEIAALVANGLSNKEIGRRMAISKRTVDAHVDHIFAKLDISSRVQLTLWLRDRIPRAKPSQQRQAEPAAEPADGATNSP
jgi:DNA-binding CsgD family transcriptional regulator